MDLTGSFAKAVGHIYCVDAVVTGGQVVDLQSVRRHAGVVAIISLGVVFVGVCSYLHTVFDPCHSWDKVGFT